MIDFREGKPELVTNPVQISSRYNGPNYYIDTQHGRFWSVGQMLTDQEINVQKLMQRKLKPGKKLVTNTDKYLCKRPVDDRYVAPVIG